MPPPHALATEKEERDDLDHQYPPGQFLKIANKSLATFSLLKKWSFPLLIKFQFSFPLAKNSYWLRLTTCVKISPIEESL